jgi:multidrug efflux pump subunit AcrA (membrane-fusion protein)
MTRDTVCVPQEAMHSMSAGSGILYVVEGDHWEPRRVRYGVRDGAWVEVLAGARPGETVVVAGDRALERGDRVRVLKGP